MIWVETGSGVEAELLGDIFFDPRVDVGEGADRAGDLAGGDLLARGDEALAVAGEFGVVPGELEPERRRLGVDAVAARRSSACICARRRAA